MINLKNEEFEKSIEVHYKKEDYTESIRDALLYLCSEIRKKSDLLDNDGVDLINKAFSEKKPLIKINKLETENDKNIHRGICDLSKGLIEYFRNPMSHTKKNYNKDVTDAVLILLDQVILKEINESKNINSVDEWYEEIKGPLCPNSKKYAEVLLSKIPKNKRFDLLVMLYRNRKDIEGDKNAIIKTFIDDLEIDRFKEFCMIIEKDFFGNINQKETLLAFKFLYIEVFQNFSSLGKTKIEELVLLNAKNFYMSCITKPNDKILLASKHLIKYFSNKQEIANTIFSKIISNSGEYNVCNYLVDKYLENIINDEIALNNEFVDFILKKYCLKSLPSYVKKIKEYYPMLNHNNEWYIKLNNVFNNAKVVQ